MKRNTEGVLDDCVEHGLEHMLLHPEPEFFDFFKKKIGVSGKNAKNTYLDYGMVPNWKWTICYLWS